MNRPFHAFGALAMFIALAVLAVSSSNRSTSVGPAARRAASPRIANVSHGSGNFLVVLPEAEPELAYIEWACGELCDSNPCYVQGCGLDRSTGEVYGASYSECLAYRRLGAVRSMPTKTTPTIQIRMATHDAALSCQGDSRDCLSHYDAQYDRAVYGTGSAGELSGIGNGVQEVAHPDAEQPVVIRWSEQQWNQQLNVFVSLLNRDANEPAHADTLQRRLRNVQSMWRGAENAALRLAAQWGWSDQWVAAADSEEAAPITWKDYAELIDQPRLDTFRAESSSPVQSGRWLLRFAASQMASASELLSSVAAELHKAAGEPRVATQSSESPR